MNNCSKCRWNNEGICKLKHKIAKRCELDTSNVKTPCCMVCFRANPREHGLYECELNLFSTLPYNRPSHYCDKFLPYLGWKQK